MELKLQLEAEQIVRLAPVTSEVIPQVILWAEDPAYVEFFRRFPPLQDWTSWDRAAQVLQGFYQVTLDGCLVGLAQVTKHDQENAELALLLVESARSSSEKVRDQMIDYAFNYLKVNRIFVRILTARTGIVKKHIDIGFKYEGTSRQSCLVNGKYYDEAIYGLLKGEK